MDFQLDFRKSLDFQNFSWFQRKLTEKSEGKSRKYQWIPMASAMVLAFCSAGSNGLVRTFDPNWHLVQLNPFGISGPWSGRGQLAVHHRWRKVLGLLHRSENRERMEKGSISLAGFALRDSSRLETNFTTNSSFHLSWMPQVDFVLVTVVWEYCSAGIGVTNLGHCHPRVAEAVREQLGKLWHAQVAGKQHWRANDQITDIRTMLHLKAIEMQEVPRTSQNQLNNVKQC